jgi:hypothetical protein
MAQASDVFTKGDTDLKVLEVKSWPKSRGVRDFAPVSLFAIHFAVSGYIGHSGRNREINGRLHCEQVVLRDQESYRDRHPMPSCTQAVACRLPFTEPTYCFRGQLPWSKILEASPIP